MTQPMASFETLPLEIFYLLQRDFLDQTDLYKLRHVSRRFYNFFIPDKFKTPQFESRNSHARFPAHLRQHVQRLSGRTYTIASFLSRQVLPNLKRLSLTLDSDHFLAIDYEKQVANNEYAKERRISADLFIYIFRLPQLQELVISINGFIYEKITGAEYCNQEPPPPFSDIIIKRLEDNYNNAGINLQNLNLLETYNLEGKLVDYIVSKAPSLKRVFVSARPNVPTVLPKLPSSMTSLHLSFPMDGYRISFQDVLGILLACPGLEKVVFRNIYTDDRTSQANVFPNFPNMKHFCTGLVGRGEFFYELDNWKNLFPNLEFLDLQGDHEEPFRMRKMHVLDEHVLDDIGVSRNAWTSMKTLLLCRSPKGFLPVDFANAFPNLVVCNFACVDFYANGSSYLDWRHLFEAVKVLH